MKISKAETKAIVRHFLKLMDDNWCIVRADNRRELSRWIRAAIKQAGKKK